MKSILYALLFIIYSVASSYAVGHTGLDGNCYYVVASGYYFNASSYGYYIATPSVILGTPGVSKNGATQYQYSAPGEWYYLEAYIYKWVGTSWQTAEILWSGQRVSKAIFDAVIAIRDGSSLPATAPADMCNPCGALAGQSNYKLDIRAEGVPANLADSCYEDCKTTAEELWEDCLNEQCVSSIKHTFTGEVCNGQPAITDLEPTQPDRCTEELDAKIAACGGSLNVQSFDFESCTGVCAPDDCHSAWLQKVNECGGIMAVSQWSASTCTGVCASDPVVNPENPPDGVSPQSVETSITQNPDGTSTETTITTYNYNGSTYTETKTITYDTQGNPTGTTVTTGQGNIDVPVNPGVPSNLELDTTVGDAKNWTEHDDTAAVAQKRATDELPSSLNAGSLPLNMNLNISGSPVLSGVMFGRTIEIRFDRPWMQSGYSIMSALLVGIGYLQVFLMINRTIIER